MSDGGRQGDGCVFLKDRFKGWVMVAYDGCKSDPALKAWLDLAKRFVNSLPKK